MSLEIKERAVGPVTCLEVRGRLTMGKGAQQLDKKLQDTIVAGCLAVLLDCSQVSIIDSQGLKVLVRGFVSLDKQGGKLKLLRMSDRVRAVLEITQLLDVIENFDDEDAALKSFFGK